jgi:uncharacterized protein (DUF433 family)
MAKSSYARSMHMDISRWVATDPEILGGTPVFVGTRVPVELLFDNLEDGMSLDEICSDYPTIPREGAIAVLEAAKREAVAAVSPIAGMK